MGTVLSRCDVKARQRQLLQSLQLQMQRAMHEQPDDTTGFRLEEGRRGKHAGDPRPSTSLTQRADLRLQFHIDTVSFMHLCDV